MKKKWSTTRITFGFLNCPECKKGINIHKGTNAYSLLIKYMALRLTVERICQKKLEIEGLTKDPKITDPNSRFY